MTAARYVALNPVRARLVKRSMNYFDRTKRCEHNSGHMLRTLLLPTLLLFAGATSSTTTAQSCRQTAGAAKATCQYGGELFSPGSTICECPNLKMEAGYLAEGGAQISSLIARTDSGSHYPMAAGLMRAPRLARASTVILC